MYYETTRLIVSLWIIQLTPPTSAPAGEEPIANPGIDFASVFKLVPMQARLEADEKAKPVLDAMIVRRWFENANQELDALDKVLRKGGTRRPTFAIPHDYQQFRNSIMEVGNIVMLTNLKPVLCTTQKQIHTFDSLPSRDQLLKDIQASSLISPRKDPNNWAIAFEVPADAKTRKQIQLNDFECWLKSVANLRTIHDFLNDLIDSENLNENERGTINARIDAIDRRLKNLEVRLPSSNPES